MKKKNRITLVHFLIWLTLSVVFFFLSERITVSLFSGIHDVGIWLTVLITGLIIILVSTLTSLIIHLKKIRKQAKTKI